MWLFMRHIFTNSFKKILRERVNDGLNGAIIILTQSL